MAEPDTSTAYLGVELPYQSIIRRWILRLMIRCDGRQNFIQNTGLRDETLARFLGLSDEEIAETDVARSTGILRDKYATAEKVAARLPRNTALASNLQKLGAQLGLTDAEKGILHFACLARMSSPLDSALDMLGGLTLGRLMRIFSECLDISLLDVRSALDAKGILSRAPILWLDDGMQFNFRGKVEVQPGFDDALTLRRKNLLDLFTFSITPGKDSALTLDRYPHLKDDIAILQPYLRSAITTQRRGVNVLLHGRPGTGKTEFVRALAKELGLSLFEVATQNDNGHARQGMARFRSFQLAQCFLKGHNDALVLFDEVEDVFVPDDDVSGTSSRRGGNKAWVNQMLETNPVASVWITNRLSVIDPAFRRRFDYVLELDVPPRSVRRRMLDDYTEHLPVGNAWREAAADNAHLAPAIIERASKILVSARGPRAAFDGESAMTRVMNNTLRALGGPQLMPPSAEQDLTYRIEALNADCDLARLREGLRRSAESRICLYGPPGTGKTAFGRLIAQSIDRPLLVRRASDILSPYVGIAERNISRMFDEAKQEGAVLLLDEADSFLQDRQAAKNGWEITQVNEMLTQMEAYRGIFIASTNLMGTLDLAALRRFDVKVKLDYLKPDQAWTLFEDLARQTGAVDEIAGHREQILSLRVLTPGDFAAVARRARSFGTCSAAELARSLANECALKREGNTRRIGF